MRCERIEPLLSAYLDRELGEAERGIVEGHVDACSRCTQALDRLQRLQHLLRMIPTEELHENLAPRIMARLSARVSPLDRVVTRVRAWGHRPVPAAITGVLVVLLIAGSIVLLRQDRPPPYPRQEGVATVVAPYVREHAFYLGRQPFADRSSILLVNAPEGPR